MAKSVGKGTTVSVSATAIGAGLVESFTPFPKTINTDDITAIDSAAEARGGSLPSWGAARLTTFWDKSDTALGTLQAASETDELAIVATFPDGSTQTATCIVTNFARDTAARRGRLKVNVDLLPIGAVTEADGA